jgi:alpha-glucosidase
MHIIKSLKLTLTLAITLSVALLASAEEPSTSQINVLRGERWWGFHLGDAQKEPAPFVVAQGNEPQQMTAVMLLSSKGRYIFNDSPMTIAFDGTTLNITAEGKRVQAQKGGRTLRDAYLVCRHKHNPPTIKERSTDIYALPIIETESELGYLQSAESVVEYAERLSAIGIKEGIVVLADGWSQMDGSFDFDRNIYPDPRATIDRLHKLGFKVMLNIAPYCSTSGRGAYVANRNNTLLEGYVATQHDCIAYYVYDICKPEVYGHLKQRLDALIADYGIDGFRFDVDELCESEKMRDNQPYLTQDYIEAWYILGENYDLIDYATSTLGQQQYFPSKITFGVDNPVRAMLISGMFGTSAPYATPAANINLDEADELTKLRLLQQELMMPVARIPFAPWRITEPKYYDEFMRNVELRSRIGEHLRSVAAEGMKTAEPMVRHLEYEYSGYGFGDCEDQYILGERYLIAPLTEGTSRTVRLPRGAWLDSKGKRYRGPMVVKFYAFDGRIFCFEKESKNK